MWCKTLKPDVGDRLELSEGRVCNTRIPGLSPTNACVYVYKYVDQKRLSCHAGHQDVSKCCTRGESEESIASRSGRTHVGDLLLLWKPRQTSPEGQNSYINGPTKRTDVLKNFIEKALKSHTLKLKPDVGDSNPSLHRKINVRPTSLPSCNVQTFLFMLYSICINHDSGTKWNPGDFPTFGFLCQVRSVRSIEQSHDSAGCLLTKGV